MKTSTKIWLGVGAFVVAGTNAGPSTAEQVLGKSASDLALTRALATSDFSAQHKGHGGQAAAQKKQGGESGGEEGGARDVPLAPDLDFALRIAQMRGHLMVGDELVKAGKWAAALPHFLHPSEELYGGIRNKLKDYQTPPFEAALKVLSNTVKARKAGDDYANAWKAVEEALAASDAGLKAKQQKWESFQAETALELLKSATGEYKEAIVKKHIAKPVEYQDARGFVWQAEKMIEAVAPSLEKKDADALKHVRDGFAALKKTWPAAMPPKAPVKDYAGVLSDVSRIELSIGKLM